jgi:hypothetical protein
MKKDKEVVRIDLTPEQKETLRQKTGKEAAALELSVEELEERIAPVQVFGSGSRTL